MHQERTSDSSGLPAEVTLISVSMVPSQECILTVTLTDLTAQRHSSNGTLQLSLKDKWGLTIQSLTYLHVLCINGTGILTSEILTWSQLRLVLIPGT